MFSPVTSALCSPAATHVHCYLVPSQLLNTLHFPSLPRQQLVHFLTPVLPNDPEYASPQTVHRSCFPSQSDVQGLSGSGPLSAVPLHGSLTWLYSNVIRSVMRRWDVFVLNHAGKLLHAYVSPTCCTAVFALLITCLSLTPNAAAAVCGKCGLFSKHLAAALCS